MGNGGPGGQITQPRLGWFAYPQPHPLPLPGSNGKELNGRKVKVVLADRDKWSVSQSRSGNVKQEDSASRLIMVSSLAASVGENQLWALFADGGRKVEAVTVERQKSTGESKGFGYTSPSLP